MLRPQSQAYLKDKAGRSVPLTSLFFMVIKFCSPAEPQAAYLVPVWELGKVASRSESLGPHAARLPPFVRMLGVSAQGSILSPLPTQSVSVVPFLPGPSLYTMN